MIKINKNMTIKQHLIIGFSAISIILFAAVFTTLILTNTLNNTTKEIVEERMPSTEKSSLMVTHINASLAALGGWLLTGNEAYKADRNAIWEDIEVTSIEMDLLAAKWQSPESLKNWSETKHYLQQFKQAQQKIENIGHTLEEKPANKVLIEQAMPIKDDMFHSISLMIDIEKNHVPDSVKKVSILTALRASMGYGGLVHNFKNYVLRGSVEAKLAFDKSVATSRTLLDEYRAHPMISDELIAVNTIGQVISEYVEKHMLVSTMQTNKNSPEAIDKKVKVDDSIIINALTYLDNINASSISGKQQIASKIRMLLGYNGFIHHFKNYLLRKDSNRKNKAEQALSEVREAIGLYRLHPLNSRESSALQDLESVVDSYRKALKKATKLIANGASAKKIDNTVRIDDKPALKALAFIDKSIANAINDPEEAIKLKSATIYDRARLLGTFSDFRNSLGAIFDALQAFILTGEDKYAQLYQSHWESNSENFTMIKERQYLLLPQQMDAFNQLLEARNDFSALPKEMFQIRRSKQWNMTNYLMATQAAPLTEKILALLAGERNSEGIREGGLAGSEQALLSQVANDNASSVTQLISLQWLLLLAGLATAFIIGKRTEKVITDPLKDITQAMTAIASGDSSVIIKKTEQRGEIGYLSKAASVFQQANMKTEEENWKKTQIANMSAKAQKADTLLVFCREVIDTLTPLVQGAVGVFYVYQAKTKLLEMEASYSFVQRKNNKTSFKLREGVIGQAAYEKQNIILSPVPEGFINVSSALGESTPVTLIVLPVLYRNELLGVVEIASFTALSALNQELLEEIMPTMALSLENLNQVIKAKVLLEETERQAEQLRASEEEIRASEEELRASEEELRVSNEELVENARGLEEKTLQLERAQIKQQEINAELSHHNEAMQVQQKALEKALFENQRQTEEIKESSRYKSEFLANMSHELRTPLNSLLILSKSLAENEDGDLNDDNKEAAEIIHESGTSLLQRINEVLDLSKVESGKMQVNAHEVRLSDISHSIERSFNHVAADKQLSFSVTLAENLPETITSDADKLLQILDNLIANAIKFTKQGEVKLLIKLPDVLPSEVTDKVVNPIQFAVIDTGIGINSAHIDTIFEPFRQADGSTSRQYGGTGLGLSISKKFAALLGGIVCIESEEGKGSEFSLYLPTQLIINNINSTSNTNSAETLNTKAEKTLPNESRAEKTIKEENESHHNLPVDNRTLADIAQFIVDDRADLVDTGSADINSVVLVVEDDPYFAKILVKRIQKQGFKAVATDNPHDALCLAQLLQPMGIVLDVELPQMDGIEVHQQLKSSAKTCHIPIHFMSASDAELRAKAVGNDHYFTKPVTQEQIDEAIMGFSTNGGHELQSVLVIDSEKSTRQIACEQFKVQAGVEVFEAETGAEALAQLQQHTIDCIILELNLPDIEGTDLLEKMSELPNITMPQVVIYSAKDLSDEEVRQLRRFTDSLILKDGSFAERLQDEVMLFLDSVKSNQETRLTSAESATEISTQQVLENTSTEQVSPYKGKRSTSDESDLANKTVLVVDDDMRNTFALSRALSDKGMKVLMAKDGEQSIAMLEKNPAVAIVLMDTMMPGMDGNEAIKIIRSKPRFKKLPVLMITAKAMKGDREVSMAAGASDYLSKPIDMDKLLSMMRAWL